MKHIKEVISNIYTTVRNGVISITETIWAIGTSIAGTDVLRKKEDYCKIILV